MTPAAPRLPSGPRRASPPPEPVDLVLRRYRDRAATPPPPVRTAAPAPAEPAFVSSPTAIDDRGEDEEWTFGPDETVEPSWPFQKVDPGDVAERGHIPRRRVGVAPRLGVVVIVAALLTGMLALTHIGPFHSASRAAATPTTTAGTITGIRGVWNVLNAYGGALYTASMHITTESRTSGAFSGTITSPVGLETIQGTVKGATLSFTIGLGDGTEQGSAVVSRTGTKVRMQGVFTNGSGGHGTIVATRTAP
ncbi:MAG TPA: hypothetical protein VII76_05260 [Acidimicrobiales bacterium]